MDSYTDSWLPLPEAEYQAIQNSLIQYAYNDAASYFLQSLIFVCSFMTIVVDMLVMAVISRTKNIRHSNSGILTFQMALAQAFGASIGVSTTITFFIKGQLTVSVETCLLAAVFGTLTTGTWLITFALSALDRYMTFAYQKTFTKLQLGLLMSLVWIMTFIISILPVIVQHHSYYKVQMSGLYSAPSYYDHSQTGIIISVAALAYLGLPNLAISSCYSAIIKLYVSIRIQAGKFAIDGKVITDPSKLTLWQTYKLINDMGQNNSMFFDDTVSHQSGKGVKHNTSKLSSRQRLELIVFRKSVATFMVYNICLLPFTIRSIYECISGNPVPRSVDSLAVFFLTFSGFATAYLNFVLDERFKSALNEMLKRI